MGFVKGTDGIARTVRNPLEGSIGDITLNDVSVTTLSSPPESKTLDYGDLNQTESSMQELRDTSMTLLTLAAMSSKYWPWALQYAVDKYNFLPRKNGIAPQRHWKDKRPPDLSIPMFGSRIVF